MVVDAHFFQLIVRTHGVPKSCFSVLLLLVFGNKKTQENQPLAQRPWW